MACYTKKEAKDLWDYAKETYLKGPLSATKKNPKFGQPNEPEYIHIATGYPDFKDLTNRLSDDIFRATKGKRRIVPEEIAKLINTPKTAKVASKNLLMTDRNRAYMLRQSKNFVTGNEKSPLARFARAAYEAPYAGKTFAHSAALHMTHAWPYAFDPLKWRNFGKSWVDSWRAMSESNARAISQDIMLNPKFDEKMSSGLAVDPRKIYDDVQHRAGFWGKLGRMTSNSFLGLKELRSMDWDAIWDTVPDHLKTDEMRQRISLHIDHMTGAPGPAAARAMSGKFGQALRVGMFAPSLDVARVMRPIDLLQGMGIEAQTALNRAPMIGEHLAKLWGRSSPEAQWMARYQMKQWTRIAAVGTSVLYLNHLLLKHFFGSDEDVNVHDPLKSDWMAPKAPDGSILQATGGQIPMIRTAAGIVINPKRSGDILGNYMMGKLNPALSIGLELRKGTGFRGEPVPAPFGEKPATVGSWAEFLTAELGPIATEEGIHEFAKQMSDQNGIDQGFNEKFLRATVKAGLVTIPAALGTHYYKPTPRKERTKEEK